MINMFVKKHPQKMSNRFYLKVRGIDSFLCHLMSNNKAEKLSETQHFYLSGTYNNYTVLQIARFVFIKIEV